MKSCLQFVLGLIALVVLGSVAMTSLSSCELPEIKPLTEEDNLKISLRRMLRGPIDKFATGPLLGGTAMLVNDYFPYWTKDGKVYAANGAAKSWAYGNDMAYAPDGVGLDSVRRAVKGVAMGEN